MKYTCPCCGYKTFNQELNGSYDVCPVCFWEDDPIQLADPDYEGGANRVSLRQAQKNFIKFGACEEDMIRHVRQATRNELKDIDWIPLD